MDHRYGYRSLLVLRDRGIPLGTANDLLRAQLACRPQPMSPTSSFCGLYENPWTAVPFSDSTGAPFNTHPALLRSP